MIGFIGSFYDYEGLDDLIDAMPALLARAARRAAAAGRRRADGRGALRRRADASPAAQAIRFVGRVPHAEVDRYYSLCDVMAYPRKASRLTELVTPLKPLEAMAQGKLVAASAVGGHRELIADGVTGTLFAPDDPADCARVLAGLLDRRGDWPALREAGRAHVAERHDWARNVSRYRDVYQALLGHRRGRPPVRPRHDDGRAAARPGQRQTGTNRVASIAFDSSGSRDASRPPISLHPAFPAVVALWFAALLGLGSMVLPVVLIERVVEITGLAALVPAASPPLGFMARGLIALASAVAGAAIGVAIARRVAQRARRRPPLAGQQVRQGRAPSDRCQRGARRRRPRQRLRPAVTAAARWRSPRTTGRAISSTWPRFRATTTTTMRRPSTSRPAAPGPPTSRSSSPTPSRTPPKPTSPKPGPRPKQPTPTRTRR